MLHPLMPFITEELYQRLPKAQGSAESICISSFPEDFSFIDNQIEKNAQQILEIVRSMLSILTQFKIDKKIKPRIAIYSSDNVVTELCSREKLLISTLCNVGEIP